MIKSAKELDEILTVLVKHNVASAKIGDCEFNIALLLNDESKKQETTPNKDDFGYTAQQAGF